MVVNWKDSQSTDRLVAAIIAAHPDLKLNYQAIATYFGQAATYDAVEGRFRRYRKMSDELKKEAFAQGITHPPKGRGSGGSTPRTPRVARGITKSASTGKGRKDTRSNLTSPTRHPVHRGMSSLDAICLDGDTSNDEKKDINGKTETNSAWKEPAKFPHSGQGGAAVLGQGNLDVEIVDAPVPVQPAGAMFPKPEERENVTSNVSSFPAFGSVKGKERADCAFPSTVPPMGLSRTSTALGQTDMSDDPFYQADLFFPTNNAGYPTDSMYFDEYDGTA
ncbi:hypothetical protein N8T08_006739 [Aspergillus melleus]|uniref:Uncharacterized protein n=1 Tax=Aspergillus melleus TaxID=138277 RepID=A0ACC3B0W2_9EURO|nr:hypothetical protein N8T08_006739 [Aspergillus melleus]